MLHSIIPTKCAPRNYNTWWKHWNKNTCCNLLFRSLSAYSCHQHDHYYFYLCIPNKLPGKSTEIKCPASYLVTHTTESVCCPADLPHNNFHLHMLTVRPATRGLRSPSQSLNCSCKLTGPLLSGNWIFHAKSVHSPSHFFTQRLSQWQSDIYCIYETCIWGIW